MTLTNSPPRRLAILVVLAGTILTQGGCLSIYNLQGPAKPYGGIRVAAELMSSGGGHVPIPGICVFLDLPFTFILDTLTLPLVLHIDNARNEEFNYPSEDATAAEDHPIRIRLVRTRRIQSFPRGKDDKDAERRPLGGKASYLNHGYDFQWVSETPYKRYITVVRVHPTLPSEKMGLAMRINDGRPEHFDARVASPELLHVVFSESNSVLNTLKVVTADFDLQAKSWTDPLDIWGTRGFIRSGPFLVQLSNGSLHHLWGTNTLYGKRDESGYYVGCPMAGMLCSRCAWDGRNAHSVGWPWPDFRPGVGH